MVRLQRKFELTNDELDKIKELCEVLTLIDRQLSISAKTMRICF